MNEMARLARLPSPRAALAILTGLNFLNYIDRFIPAAILSTILGSFGLSNYVPCGGTVALLRPFF